MTTSATAPSTCSRLWTSRPAKLSPTAASATPVPMCLPFSTRWTAPWPGAVSIHVVLDNLSAHMGPEVETWLAHRRQARWHLHFVPTSSSWLNLVERWFADLTERRLRRGVFTSVGAL